MIETVSSVAPAPSQGAATPGKSAGAGAFLMTLSGVLGGEGEEPGAALPALPGLPGKRQGLAETGKDLPAADKPEDLSKDVIWLPTGMIVVPYVETALTVVAGGAGGPAITPPPVPGAGVPGQGGLPPQPATDLAAGLTAPTLTVPTPELSAEQKVATETKDGVAIKADGLLIASDGKPAASPRLRVDAAALPQVAQPQAPITQPAGQVFAAAIASAVAAQARPEDRDTTDVRTPLSIATAALEARHSPAIQAMADAKQSALDLKQDSGLQGMIDHIEVLRDNANAGDTRIRLVPDALGAVDVSVRKDGDRVHVHFNTENQVSARLLSDAQPRLAELAEARGVKLGDTSVDSGQGNARQQQSSTPTFASAPAPVRGAETLEDTDSRIA